ncbi:hypothetical protein [Streptomyces tateyamensis]|uniref:hypothetical protein n=1 Tax=Streptomyces tateyamensis TaxID=565073 RepID=UPI001C6493E3|nr:hypothetical protein [Streptomyces tateyamensis]
MLTKRGWLTFGEFSNGDQVLTLNRATGSAEWQPVLGVEIAESGWRRMILMDGQAHSSLTVPSHQWAVERYSRRPSAPRQRDGRGCRAVGADRAPVQVASWEREFASTEQLRELHRVVALAPLGDPPPLPVHDDAFVELVAWFWTEGHINRSRGKLTSGVTIYQSHVANPRHVDRIRAMLSRLYGSPVEALSRQGDTVPRWRVYRNGHKTEFRLNHVAGAEVLRVVAAPDKVVRPEFISSLTAGQLELFIDVSILADGCYSVGGGAEITQKVRERLDALQIACALTGRYTNLRPSHYRGVERWALGISGSVRTTRFFPVSAAKRGGRFTISTVWHRGPVWGPRTVNGFWMARRRGTVYFTGGPVVPVQGCVVPRTRESN